MGVFDSIFINIKCPYCGKTSRIECQTKDTNDFLCLMIWNKGDYISDKFVYLDSVGQYTTTYTHCN